MSKPLILPANCIICGLPVKAGVVFVLQPDPPPVALCRACMRMIAELVEKEPK